jgi:imidazole glycerol-phosphate synthase subunit HisH
MKIAIIDYNLGNLFSVKNAINSLGVEAIITNDYNEIMNSEAAILPGVGAFNKAMENIITLGLDKIIFDYIKTGKPFIGICLGFQLLFTRSFEFEETKGLDIIDGEVQKIPSQYDEKKIIVPNVGWLPIYNDKDSWSNPEFNEINQFEYMYFVHSFYVKPSSDEYIIAKSRYENFEFCSAVKKNNVFGVQFHPEKSGKSGIKIYKNIIKIIKGDLYE